MVDQISGSVSEWIGVECLERTSRTTAGAQLGYISYDSVALNYLEGVIIRDCLIGRDIELKAIATESPAYITYLGRFFVNGRCV